MGAVQITSQGIAGTNVTIGPDGKINAPFSSAALDLLAGPTVGGVLYRSPLGWTSLPPGSPGQVLQTNGGNVAPSWATTTSSVTSAAMDAAFGSATGSLLYRSGGGWASLTIGASLNSLLSNAGGAPTWQTVSSFLDTAFSGTQGAILFRGPAVWTALAPGTAGYVLTTGGAGANPSWTVGGGGGGGGTVTSVGLSMPGIFTVSGSPITGAGTLTANLATQSANLVFAGPSSGAAAAPTFRSLVSGDLPSISSLLDGISTTQGAVLYRGASSWSALGPGTSGQFLQTAGAAANPVWANTPSAGGFPSGTLMLFQQTAAPTGWTKQTTHNDKALRVVSGTASSGGSNSFSSVMAQTVVGSTTLSTGQVPDHTHPYGLGDSASPSHQFDGGSTYTPHERTVSSNTSGAGLGGGSHNHTISFSIQYVDLIIASAP